MEGKKNWLVACGCAAAMLIGHAPAQAQPRGTFSAALSAPLAAPRQEIIGGALWKCAGERCAAPADGSRALLVCQRVVKAFGPVASFTAPSGAMSSEDLSRCNGQS